jgi:hypothetical protein
LCGAQLADTLRESGGGRVRLTPRGPEIHS